jgi:8-oxo-dGTP pyrophosphatase MutT (NUDIX family)
MLPTGEKAMVLDPAEQPNYTILSTTTAYRNPWTELREDRLQRADGSAGLYGWLAPVDCAIVLPRHDDGSISLVRQWRHAWGQSSWELPCGRLEPGEDALSAAQRELAEETGLKAASWTAIGTWHHSDARVAGNIHAFVAEHFSDTPARRDDTEDDLVIERVSEAEIWGAIADGRITQVATIAALARVKATAG